MRGDVRVLHEISFEIYPDEFVGILGPSGAGKSTLLNCLATYQMPTQGRIAFDGGRDQWVDLDEYRGILGYVPQQDVVYARLTVRENLVFAARLRLGPRQAGEVAVAVDRALELVGLTVHSGKPTSVLSGGQCKRLNVAMELLKRPRLLLLDEPTSGLDPATESHLMEQLRVIARRGTTVACTTHLMDNVRLFDRVIVLGEQAGSGRIAYSGPPDRLLDHFGCRNFADLYEKLRSGDFHPVVQEPSASLDASSVERTSTDSNPIATIPRKAPAARPFLKVAGSSEEVTPRQMIESLVTSEPAGQLALLMHRSFHLLLRDRRLVGTLVAQPLLLGGLVCLSQYDALRAAPLLFFLIIVAIWMGLNNSARELVGEPRRQYVRERLGGLRPDLFLASKWVLHSFVGFVQILLLMIVLGLSRSLHTQTLIGELDKISTVWLFLILMAAYTGALGVGLLISAGVRTEATAVALLPMLILPQILVSAVGTGQTDGAFYQTSGVQPFRPLGTAGKRWQDLPSPAKVLDVVSMFCLSRPAILLLVKPRIGIADLAHLFLLVAVIWILAYLVFLRSEQRWMQLIGVGGGA